MCERYIDTLRAAGVPRDNLEDPVLERMDALWLQMTDEERALVQQRAATTPVAPLVELQDRIVAIGSHELPRIEVVREKE